MKPYHGPVWNRLWTVLGPPRAVPGPPADRTRAPADFYPPPPHSRTSVQSPSRAFGPRGLFPFFFYFCPRGPPGHVAASHTAFAVFAVRAVRPCTDFRHFSALDLTSLVTGWPRTLSLYINLFVSRRATRSFFPRSSSSIRGETSRGGRTPPPPLCRGRMRNGLCRRGLTYDVITGGMPGGKYVPWHISACNLRAERRFC